MRSNGIVFHDLLAAVVAPLLLYMGKVFTFSLTALSADANPKPSFYVNLHKAFDGLQSIESEMFSNFSSLSLDGLPLCCAFN